MSRNLMTPSPLQPCPSPRSLSKITLIWGFIGVLIAFTIGSTMLISPTGADSSQCRSIYMYPSYAHLKGFDLTHTALASKYNLYLYREQGKDKIPDSTLGHGEFHGLDGIPVLFIPGNAGSFKQVRSIAAEVANVYDLHRMDVGWQNKNMDFFAAHFNEDFTAFHGRTMLDQAEYLNDAIRFILSLYASQENPPTSVIIIGHSMGGVVSRVMLTLPNYVEDSVNTIITLAAPHAAAPATFDGDIMRIYAATDRFWRAGFSQDSGNTIAKARLSDVSIISITGGLSDTILPADYTTLKGLVPDTHGFTIYTTGIPGVWTPIDHLAIVWCDQFRRIIASTLFVIVNPNVPKRTISLSDRMRVLRRNLLSGLETYSHSDYINIDDTPSMTIPIKNDNIVLHGKSKTLTSSSKFHAFSIMEVKNPHLSFLSTTKPNEFNEVIGGSLMLCNITAASADSASMLDETEFHCIDIAADAYQVPNPHSSIHDSSAGGSHVGFYSSSIPPSILSTHAFVIYQPLAEVAEDDFTTISIESTLDSEVKVRDSIFKLLFGSTVTLSASSLMTKITYENVWSSMFAYKIKVSVDGSNHSFPPFMAQVIQDPMETKWHLNLKETKHISFHSVAPYTPYSTLNNPLELNIWSPETVSKITVSMKIDVLRSLRLLVIRYRLGVASMPTFLILLVLLVQFDKFYKTGTFPTLEEGLSEVASKTTTITSLLAILVPLGSTALFQRLFYFLDPIALTSPKELGGVHVNPYYFGLEDKAAWLLGPIYYLLSLASVTIVLLILRSVLMVIPKLVSLMSSFSKNHITGLKDITVLQGVQDIATGPMKDTRRIMGSFVLLVFVMFYIPYQFAYIVCCLVQCVSTVKTHIASEDNQKEKIDTRRKNIANFNLSLLLLMLWIIPVNIPVLVVSFHNMSVRWKTPFTSHHNILAILPIIILVGKNVQGGYLPIAKLEIQRKITFFVLGYFAFFALIYGIRHLYWLHYLLNFFAAWLVILSVWKV